MHELSIVEALVGQVEQEIQQAGLQGRVRRLQLTIGRLSGVCPDSIRFALELVAPGTRLQDAEVVIDEPSASCRCNDCRACMAMEGLVMQCPRCGSGDIVIEGGRELLLQSIEVENLP